MRGQQHVPISTAHSMRLSAPHTACASRRCTQHAPLRAHGAAHSMCLSALCTQHVPISTAYSTYLSALHTACAYQYCIQHVPISTAHRHVLLSLFPLVELTRPWPGPCRLWGTSPSPLTITLVCHVSYVTFLCDSVSA